MPQITYSSSKGRQQNLLPDHTYSSVIVPLVIPAKALLGMTSICMLCSRSLKKQNNKFSKKAFFYTDIIIL